MKMKIDSHHHVWDLDVRPQPWTAPFPLLARTFSMDDLRPSLLASGIDATVVVQTVTVAEETPELLELAARDPAVAGVVGWVDLAARDVAEKLAQLREGPNGSRLVGIRHQVQEEELDWLGRNEVRAGLRAISNQRLAYDLIIRREQLPSAVAAAEAVPELRFILDHGGNPAIEDNEFEPWRGHLSALAALPNTAVKLSGLTTCAGTEWCADDLRPYVNHLFSTFGPSRVLFGTDWPVCLLRASYEQTVEIAEELTADLNSTERYGLFGGNAVSWYQLAP